MILNDKEIAALCTDNPDAPMIEPFIPESVSTTDNGAKILSLGLSSFGYDITLAGDIYVFHANPALSTIVDPKRFNKDVMKKARIYSDGDSRYVLIPPNSFILGYSNERIRMPEDVMAIVLTKSTIARVGGVCTATPLEPNWTGNITLEFANLTAYPFKMYIDEGCAQLVFLKGNRPNITYSDRNNGQGGKYQNQGPEVVVAKV